MSTYNSRVEAALAALATFNSKVPADKRIDPDGFKNSLTVELGAVDEATIALVSVEDLLGLKIPSAIARQMVQIFRSAGSPSAEVGPVRRITASNAPSASVQDLVFAYDPFQPTSPAAEEIRKRTNNARCLVFNVDGQTINREATIREVTALINNDPEREIVVIDNVPMKLYRVGERPPKTIDEHPLYKGTPLRSDGTDQLGLNWTKIPLEVRQLLLIAVSLTGELSVNTNDEVHDVYTRASAADATQTLRARYLQAALKFKELEQAGNLPTLKVIRGSSGNAGKPNDPFHGSPHRQY